jgi:hypothetical protein
VLRRARVLELDIAEPDYLGPIEHLPTLYRVRIKMGTMPTLRAVGRRPPGLTDVTVEGRPRMSIAGIERWNGIRSLTISSANTPVDLSPLAGMGSLEVLHVSIVGGTGIRFALTPLRDLPNLRELRLETSSRARVDLADIALVQGLSVFLPQHFHVENALKTGTGSQLIRT